MNFSDRVSTKGLKRHEEISKCTGTPTSTIMRFFGTRSFRRNSERHSAVDFGAATTARCRT